MASPKPVIVAYKVAVVPDAELWGSPFVLLETTTITPTKEIIIPTISILLIFVPWTILAKMVVMNGFVEKITVKVATEMYLRLVI